MTTSANICQLINCCIVLALIFVNAFLLTSYLLYCCSSRQIREELTDQMIEAKCHQCEDVYVKITHALLTSCFGASPRRFGRKPVFFFTMVLQSVTALIQAASVSWVMFCVLNCLKGLGQVSSYSTSLILGERGSTHTSVGLKRVPTSLSTAALS